MTVEIDNTKQPDVTSSTLRRWVLLILKLAVAGGLLFWLFHSRRLDLSPLRNVRHLWYLVLGLLSLLASRLLPIWRWTGLLRIQQLKVGWVTALRMTWLGYFAGLFLPGAAGGDLAKAYVACRHRPNAKTRAVSTVLVDRICGLHSLLFVGALAGATLLIRGADAAQAAVLAFPIVLFAGATGAILLLLWRPTSGFALRLLPRRFRGAVAGSLALYRAGLGRLAGLWVLSGLCSLMAITSYYFASAAMGLAATPAQVLTVMPPVIVANSVPISPGGLGVGEAAGSGLFGLLGLENGALIVLVVRLGVVMLSLPGVLMLFGRFKGGQRTADVGTEPPASSAPPKPTPVADQ